MRYLGALTAACSLWMGMTPVPAAEPDPAALQELVLASGEKFVKAFADRDPKAIAGLFTPEAEYVDSTGVIFHGREAIEAEYIAAFEVQPAGTLTLELISIRPIAEGVVVEDGVSTFEPKEGGPASRMRYTATHVKQADGGWLVASARELEPAVVTPHDQLRELEWLVGKWRDEAEGQVVETEWKWSPSGNFLEGAFRIHENGQPASEGTHRIGWDARRKQFRSWIFNANGSFANGFWTTDDDGNLALQLSGVTDEGGSTSSLLTYVRDGDDAVGVYQTQRVVDGDSLPSRSIRVVRQPPAPEVTDVPQ